MKQIVFYSWQSDLPNSCNRGFIQDALESAAAAITADDTVEVEPVIDRDTQGVPGAPDIASTIFSKITAADVFVADVSITGRDDKRATPNPNVLIELGYAFKALGHERVILVFNRTFGMMEELPFDLRMRRVLAYNTPEKAGEKSAERKNLEKQLNTAIRAALPEPCCDPEAEWERGMLVRRSAAAIQCLTVRDQSLLAEYLNADHGSLKEMCRALRLPGSTMRYRMRRIFCKLRAAIGEKQ